RRREPRAQVVAQRPAAHHVHRVPRHATGDAVIADRDHARVAELAQRLDLAADRRPRRLGRDPHGLDREIAAARIARALHHAHAAETEHLDDAIAADLRRTWRHRATIHIAARRARYRRLPSITPITAHYFEK